MVIPIHDENPVRRTPVVTYLLIAINVVVFLFEPVVSELPVFSSPPSASALCHQEAFFDRYAAVPKELVTDQPLVKPVPTGQGYVDPQTGNVVCEATRHPGWTKQPVLSVLTAMFLHGGWLHLLGNMLFLWVFGNNVEDRLGRLRYLLFYLGCGYVAAYAFAWAFPTSTTPLIGASGAIAGVLGSYAVLYPRARVTSLVPFLFFLPFRLPAWVVLGGWFVLQWWYSTGAAVAQGADVAYFAHVAGFIVGGLVTWLFFRRRPRPTLGHSGWT